MIDLKRRTIRVIALLLATSMALPLQFLPGRVFAQSGALTGTVISPPKTVKEEISHPAIGLPAPSAELSVPRKSSSSSHSGFRQLVIYVPDIFDTPKDVAYAMDRLRRKGIPEEDIINLAQDKAFDTRKGLKEQAQMLSRIVERESARRLGLKAHLVAKGTGGLVAQSYLLTAKRLRTAGAPIEDVVALGVPHQGRGWAKIVYALGIPLPGAGVRSLAIRDLAPDSAFMRELKYYQSKKDNMIADAQSVLKKIDSFDFKKEMRARLAAMDHTKKEVSDHVERIIHFPDRIKLGDADKRRISSVQKEEKVAAKTIARFQEQLASHRQAKPELLKKTADQIKAQQQAVEKRVHTKTQTLLEWEKSSGVAASQAKLATISQALVGKADQARAVLQDRAQAATAFQLSSRTDAPEARLLHQVEDAGNRLGKAVVQTAWQKPLDAVEAACAQGLRPAQDKSTDLFEYSRLARLAQAMRTLEKQKDNLCSQLSRELLGMDEKAQPHLARNISQLQKTDLDKTAVRLAALQKEVAAITNMKTAWETMGQARQQWQTQVAEVAALQAEKQIQQQAGDYMTGLSRQINQLPDQDTVTRQWQGIKKDLDTLLPEV
ncbi:hypothetical protein K8S19_12505, partial [bacterium]|nr:hypothetical protein [bacterium]